MINNDDIEETNDLCEGILAGDESYQFHTDQDMDNIESMAFFIDENGLGDLIDIDDGTQVTLSYRGHVIVMNSHGLGDFYSHEILFTVDPED